MVDQPAPRAVFVTPAAPPVAPPQPIVPEFNHDYDEPAAEAPPVETEEKPHPLVAALDAQFPDEKGHAKASLYARTRAMFAAIVDEVTGKKS